MRGVFGVSVRGLKKSGGGYVLRNKIYIYIFIVCVFLFFTTACGVFSLQRCISKIRALLIRSRIEYLFLEIEYLSILLSTGSVKLL